MAASKNTTPSKAGSTQIGGVNISFIWYWGVGGIMLLALAAPAPNIATMIMIILIAGVVLINWSDYSGLLNPPASS